MKELNISFKYNSNEKLLLIAISPKGFFTICFRIFKFPKDNKVWFSKFFVFIVKETRSSYFCVTPVNISRRKLLAIET